MVAHNAEFDIEMLKKEEVYPKKFICTLKLARYLDREGILEKYNLQYLRYYYNITINANAHDAFGDILVLEAIFEKYYKEIVNEYGYNAINEMIEISKNPVQIKRMPFGKYKGKKIEEIPQDYLSWLSGTDIDSDMRYTVEQQLRKFQNHRN
jgi:DNA polymerase III epsilon subunit-like protein